MEKGSKQVTDMFAVLRNIDYGIQNKSSLLSLSSAIL
jgi:hypothetical protein